MKPIDADALKENYKHSYMTVMQMLNGQGNTLTRTMLFNTYQAMCIDLDQAPTLDVVPVIHAHWEDEYPNIESNPMFAGGTCSHCGTFNGVQTYYCPRCGARMDEIVE